MIPAASPARERSWSDVVSVIGLIFGTVLGLFLAARATDSAIAFHAWIIVFSCIAGAIFVSKNAFYISAGTNPAPDQGSYNETVIKASVIAAMFWGVAGFLVGDLIAWQLALPVLNFDIPYTTF